MKDYRFGNFICGLRTELGLSQFQLGYLVGVSDKAVSKWENGDARPRIATCCRLAEVLGISIHELLSCERAPAAAARKEWDHMNETLWKEAYKRLSVYGEHPPAVCVSRLAAERQALGETDAIQSFAILGRIVSAAEAPAPAAYATGTVSSSFAAWLLGATKVNPLPPHYRCPQCGKTEFVPEAADGFDLPRKRCACGEEFLRDGHNIPFEGAAKREQRRTAVDLRVSEQTKPLAVMVIREFYHGKAEILPVKLILENGDTAGIEHYVILDGGRPAPQRHADGFWYAGAEEFWNWWERETTYTVVCDSRLQRLRLLQERTKVCCPDPLLLATSETAERLYRKERDSFVPVKTMTDAFGENEPHDFHMLLKMYGFCHGSGVWADYLADGEEWSGGNGEQLVKDGRASFRKIPAFREEIWNDVSLALARNSIRDNGLALQVMEDAYMGRYWKNGMTDAFAALLLSLGLPAWYPEYLKKTMHLFTKGAGTVQLLLDLMLDWYCENCQEVYEQVRRECQC